MPIITISRGTLSGGEMLARSLHERLGFKLLSREVIIEAARKYGVSEEKLVKEMQTPARLWTRLTSQKQRYVLAVQATLAELVEDGNAIYYGLAGQFLLQGLSRVLNVRLIAPMASRVRVAMSEHGLSHEDAFRFLQTVDEQRARWVRQLYSADWNDPILYDIVVNLAHMTLESATEMVVDLVRRKEYCRSAESDREFRDFSLDRRLSAALTFQSDFPEDSVQLSVREGVVYIGATGYVERNLQSVLSFVKGVPGVQAVVAPGDEADLADGPQSDIPAEKAAADIMVPIQRYPHIPQSITIREAIVALGASSVVLQDGHLLSPRYLLVLDEMERLVGIVARRDLLRGLAPSFRTLDKAREMIESVVPFADLSYTSSPWVSFFSSAAISNARESVGSVMAPIRGAVKPDDDLSVVVTSMLQHSVDMVPVVDGERAMGVVLMTDVFDTVAQFILEKGAPRAMGTREEPGEENA
jgi:cytidylate kinase/CBS domain-containing protein